MIPLVRHAHVVLTGLYVGVVGPTTATPEWEQIAHEVGTRLARSGCVLICGGMQGVMEAACRGAYTAGGLTVGLLPHGHRGQGNQYLSVALPTGLGELRNGLIVRSSDVLVAIGGSWGTMSEVALAMTTDKPVVALGAWGVVDSASNPVTDGPARARSVEELWTLLESESAVPRA